MAPGLCPFMPSHAVFLPESLATDVSLLSDFTGGPKLPHEGLLGTSSCSNLPTALPTTASPVPPRARYPSMASSPTPCLFSRARSWRFSSATRRAASWISVAASTPWSSTRRRRASRSWTYSFLRARERRWLSRMRARFALSFMGLLHPSSREEEGTGGPGGERGAEDRG